MEPKNLSVRQLHLYEKAQILESVEAEGLPVAPERGLLWQIATGQNIGVIAEIELITSQTFKQRNLSGEERGALRLARILQRTQGKR